MGSGTAVHIRKRDKENSTQRALPIMSPYAADISSGRC